MDQNKATQFFLNSKTDFSKQQEAAITSIDGPTLLLAVPGSGKTTVLVNRLKYMIDVCGIDPLNILTVTYTVQATKDMERRFRALYETDAPSPEFRTINGLSQKVILKFEALSGQKTFKLETDEGKLTKLVSDLYRHFTGEFALESDIKSIRTFITYAKNMMYSVDDFKKLDLGSIKLDDFTNIYTAYNKRLREECLMDYDDQMVYALRILKRFPDILSFYTQKYLYIMVDEAQDTSFVQHEIIKLLAGSSHNLFMVGDEDQSIYGFRAAYPKALLEFEKVYANAKVLYLEKNYRSDKAIVDAADAFIKKNKNRHDKTMTAFHEFTTEVARKHFSSRMKQYDYLLELSSNIAGETAILYRDNESAVPLIDLFERNGIKYRLRASDFVFFSHRIVTDIINIITYSNNIDDPDLFINLYYKMSFYLSKAKALEVYEKAKRSNMSLSYILLNDTELSSKVYKSVRNVIENLKGLRYLKGDEAVRKIVGDCGYGDYIKRSRLQDTKTFILEALGRQVSSPNELVLRLVELNSIISNKEPSYDSKLILSTIHSSKGLEYDNVLLIDEIDGVFPEVKLTKSSKPSKEVLEKHEEERRLFYVGCTRAKKTLTLLAYERKSSFVDEFTNHKEAASSQPKKPVYGNFKNANQKRSIEPDGDDAFEKFKRSLKPDRTVAHASYGIGTIEAKNENMVVIQFNDKQRKFRIDTLYENELIEVVD